jgi:hypothetical protein
VVGNQSGGSITATTGSYSSNLTVGSGVTIGSAGVATFSGTGDVHLTDNVNLYLGDSKDSQILHNGTNFTLVNDTGSIYIQNDATDNPDAHIYIRAKSGENSIHCADDGNVELYFDNDRKIRTIASGAQVESTTGDTQFVVMAEEDDSSVDAIITARTTHDSASSYLMFGDGSDANIGKIRYNHSVDDMLFYTNDTEKWRITSGGNLQNNSDSGKLQLGTSEDLEIYHDGSHSYIDDSGTGSLYLKSNQFMAIGANGETMIQATEDAGVYLRYNNGVKFETTNDGTVTTGISTATQGFSFLGSATYGIEARSNSTQSTDTNKALKVRNNSDTNTFSVSYKGEVFVGPYDGGFLGIGTDNPQTQLHITAAGPILTHDATNGSSGLRINSQQYQTSGQLLRVQNAGITTFVIQRNGYVGINTHTVQRGPLHVHSNGTGDCQIHLTNDETGPTGNDGFTVFTGGDAGPDAGFVNRESGGAIEMYTHNGSSVGERLRVGSAGQIGIAGANYGTDGQVLTSTGASSAPAWEDAAGGMSEVDIWSFTQAISISGSGENHIDSNLSRFAPDAGWSKLGTGMTLGGSYWTFPSTGTWECVAAFTTRGFNASSNWGKWGWDYSGDTGSSWDDDFMRIAQGATSSSVRNFVYMPAIFTITNVSTQKVRFSMYWQGNNGGANFTIDGGGENDGDSNTLTSYYMFKKLA